MFIDVLNFILLTVTCTSPGVSAKCACAENSGNVATYRVSGSRYVSVIDENGVILASQNHDDSDPLGDRSASGTQYCSIANKYFEMGSSSTNSGTTLTVGKSALFGMQSEFRAAFNITLPTIDLNYYKIESAGFIVTRQSGALSSLNCYKVDGVSYANLNGMSSPTLTYADSTYISGVSFAFDLSDLVLEAYENEQSSVTLLLQGFEQNKVANIASISAATGFPRFFVEYSNYGSATPYDLSIDGTIDHITNCMGYAYDGPGHYADIENELYASFQGQFVTYSTLSAAFIYAMANAQIPSLPSYRILSSYDALIATNERRIAFRVGVSPEGKYNRQYHFMRQDSDGSWSLKEGTHGEFQRCLGEESVLNESHWFGYGSATLFVALED